MPQETIFLENGVPENPGRGPTNYTRRLSTAGVTNVIEVRDADFRWSRATKENRKGAGSQPHCILRLFCGVQKRNDEDRWWEDIDLGGEGDHATMPPSLSNVEMAVPPGSLVCIMGRVGAGKSTLLNGLLNEVPCVRGNVTVTGKIAYCSQLPWIQNLSVRDNILCGNAFDQDKYDHAISVCDMSDDMRAFADGPLCYFATPARACIRTCASPRSRQSVFTIRRRDRDRRAWYQSQR
eukprot:COSAG01_NODE_2438_length_7692_cov_5.703016_4_plen_237_part_00